MDEQPSDEEEPLPQSVLDMLSGNESDHTITDTLTSDTEEGGDSFTRNHHLRSDSLHISRASKHIKKEQGHHRSGWKRVGGMCSVCS